MNTAVFNAKIKALSSEPSDLFNLYQADSSVFFPINGDEIPSLHISPKLKTLSYAFIYPAYSEARILEERQFCNYLAKLGFKVKSIPIYCRGGWWPFSKLNSKFKLHLPSLRFQYTRLKRELQGIDVMIASGGPMLHPEFVRQLHTYNILICADDPESSECLSKPIATAFDHCFPINFASLDDYSRWGCSRVDWLFHPIPPQVEIIGKRLIQAGLGERKISTAMFCERVFNLSNRASRIERLVDAFPETYISGRGWPRGFITTPEMYQVLTDSKIGWNLHNSTGPCNTRFTTLPALGVLQICDNKSTISHFFKLNEEIIGFNSIEECIELTHHYLKNDQQRATIAYNGLNRTLKCYTLDRWWERVLNCITPYINE